MPRPKAGTGPKPSISPPERYPSGDPKPQHEERGKAPALVKRIMDHAVSLGADARCATVLGRMHLEGILTETEFAAGMLYAEDVGAYERVKGHPRRTARSPSFDSGFGRSDVDLEALERMDPDAAAKLKARMQRRVRRIEKRYHKAQNCIPHLPILLSTLIEEVCCNDRPVHGVHHATVKAMLSNLAKRCYRLNEIDSPAQRAPKRDKKADVKDLAQAAVDALGRFFEKNRARVAFFRVQQRHALQSRVIVAYGMADQNKQIEHKMVIKRLPGLKGEAIDEALGRAALAKGWNRSMPMREPAGRSATPTPTRR